MLILASTSDKLQVTSSNATATLSVHASWADISSNTVTPGRTNTSITGAATTNVVDSPANSTTYRTVKTLTIRNTHATLNQTVTVTHYNGSVSAEMYICPLIPGEGIHYVEGRGFSKLDNLGRSVGVENTNVGSITASGNTVVVLGGDVTGSASANTLADVTGLSFAVTSGKMYYFQFNPVYTINATTTGTRWTLNGPAFTYLNYWVKTALTAATETLLGYCQVYDYAVATNATSAAAGNNWARIEGIIQPSANGTLIVRNASELATAITTKAGSFAFYRALN